jgi:hypothetical protein
MLLARLMTNQQPLTTGKVDCEAVQLGAILQIAGVAQDTPACLDNGLSLGPRLTDEDRPGRHYGSRRWFGGRML